MKKFFRMTVLVTFGAIVLAFPAAAAAQHPTESAQQSGTRRTAGTVTSARRGSIVVRSDQGQFVVFVVNRDTVRSPAVRPGARVSVVTMSNDIDAAPTAIAITLLADAPEGTATADEPVPAEVRRLEAQIERQVRRYRVGVAGGVALDPELISMGAHATLGPFFNRNVAFRPNLELAIGEVTTLLVLHLDVLYTIPGATRQTRWAPYVGAGPNVSFSHRGFEGDEDDNRFDFDEFNADSGFNVIAGAQNPNGAFVEMKATAYGVANVRLLVGFNF